jgi:hypothetical protein
VSPDRPELELAVAGLAAQATTPSQYELEAGGHPPSRASIPRETRAREEDCETASPCATEPRRLPGRPSALTRERADRLVALLSAGETVTSAAATLGVSRRTVERWRARAWSREPRDAPFVVLERRLRDVLRARDVPDELELEDWSELARRLELDQPDRWSLIDDDVAEVA